MRVFRERLSICVCASFHFGFEGGMWDSIILILINAFLFSGWSGGAMVLGKLPVPGRPTNFDKSRVRAYCACNRCRGGCLDIFSLDDHNSFLSPSLWETARYRLKDCLKGPLSPKQPTNQPFFLLCTARQYTCIIYLITYSMTPPP